MPPQTPTQPPKNYWPLVTVILFILLLATGAIAGVAILRPALVSNLLGLTPPPPLESPSVVLRPIELAPPPIVAPVATSTIATTTIETKDWKTYRNEKIGIELKYPPDWTGVKESTSDCYDYSPEQRESQEPCNEISINNIKEGQGKRYGRLSSGIISSESNLYQKHPIPTDGWITQTGWIKNPSSISDNCSSKTILCRVYKNKFGFDVVKGIYDNRCVDTREVDCVGQKALFYTYYLYNNITYPGISVVGSDEETLDTLVDTIKPLTP